MFMFILKRSILNTGDFFFLKVPFKKLLTEKINAKKSISFPQKKSDYLCSKRK